MDHKRRILKTTRLNLRHWDMTDAEAFAKLHADPDVMHDLGGPIDYQTSDKKLQEYIAAYDQHGISRWAVETHEGVFLGYVGILPHHEPHPLGTHDEIGWRLHKPAWGAGYATEAAIAALQDAFSTNGLNEVISYTAPENLRSQIVMGRLGLVRDTSRDFYVPDEVLGTWHGWVWRTDPTLFKKLIDTRVG